MGILKAIFHGKQPKESATAPAPQLEQSILAETVARVSTRHRGINKRSELPIDAIKSWVADGLSIPHIVLKLDEQGIRVSTRTIQRRISDIEKSDKQPTEEIKQIPTARGTMVSWREKRMQHRSEEALKAYRYKGKVPIDVIRQYKIANLSYSQIAQKLNEEYPGLQATGDGISSAIQLYAYDLVIPNKKTLALIDGQEVASPQDIQRTVTPERELNPNNLWDDFFTKLEAKNKEIEEYKLLLADYDQEHKEYEALKVIVSSLKSSLEQKVIETDGLQKRVEELVNIRDKNVQLQKQLRDLKGEYNLELRALKEKISEYAWQGKPVVSTAQAQNILDK